MEQKENVDSLIPLTNTQDLKEGFFVVAENKKINVEKGEEVGKKITEMNKEDIPKDLQGKEDVKTEQEERIQIIKIVRTESEQFRNDFFKLEVSTKFEEVEEVEEIKTLENQKRGQKREREEREEQESIKKQRESQETE